MKTFTDEIDAPSIAELLSDFYMRIYRAEKEVIYLQAVYEALVDRSRQEVENRVADDIKTRGK